MSMQDLLSDFVARVNNAKVAGKTQVLVLKNKIIVNICKKLVTLEYFESFEDLGNNTLLVTLNVKKINRLQRVSRPGQRVYTSYDKLPRIVGGKGFNILSTSGGIKTNFEAKRDKFGGELVLQVY